MHHSRTWNPRHPKLVAYDGDLPLRPNGVRLSGGAQRSAAELVIEVFDNEWSSTFPTSLNDSKTFEEDTRCSKGAAGSELNSDVLSFCLVFCFVFYGFGDPGGGFGDRRSSSGLPLFLLLLKPPPGAPKPPPGPPKP